MRGFHPNSRYLVLEGMDWAIRGLQHKIVCDRLEDQGYEIVRTAEPTDGYEGTKIREIMLRGDPYANPILAAHRSYQDCEINMKSVIGPALREGKVVVSDGSFYSAFAHLSARYFAGLSVLDLHRKYSPPTPDQVVVIDTPVDGKGSLLKRLRSDYQNLAKRLPHHRIEYVDGCDSAEDVHRRVWHYFEKMLPPVKARSLDLKLGQSHQVS